MLHLTIEVQNCSFGGFSPQNGNLSLPLFYCVTCFYQRKCLVWNSLLEVSRKGKKKQPSKLNISCLMLSYRVHVCGLGNRRILLCTSFTFTSLDIKFSSFFFYHTLVHEYTCNTVNKQKLCKCRTSAILLYIDLPIY